MRRGLCDITASGVGLPLARSSGREAAASLLFDPRAAVHVERDRELCGWSSAGDVPAGPPPFLAQTAPGPASRSPVLTCSLPQVPLTPWLSFSCCDEIRSRIQEVPLAPPEDICR